MVIIPNGADPADLVQSKNTNKLEKTINNRVEAGELVIKNIINNFTYPASFKNNALEEIKKFTNSLKPVVAISYQKI